MFIPSRFLGTLRTKTIHTKIFQRRAAVGPDTVQGADRDAHHIAGLDFPFFCILNPKCAASFEHIKYLLGVVMSVWRRPGTLRDNHDKNFCGRRIATVEHDVIDMGRELVSLALARGKSVLNASFHGWAFYPIWISQGTMESALVRDFREQHVSWIIG